MLRPGIHVLRRSADELQVGLDPSRAVVLPDRPEVRASLAFLTSPASIPDEQGYDVRALRLLADAGLLVDADALLPLIPTGPPRESQRDARHDPVAGRADVAALAAHSGERTAALLDARATARIEVITCGSREALSVASELTRLLGAAGVGQRGVKREQEPTAGLVLTVGEPPRERADALMRAGTPHLFLRLSEGHAVIGPFVVPGETACLRCVDAHHTDVDAAWPLLVTQQATAVAHEREDTVPEPVDSLLATLASAWAARELVSFAEGRRPATTSTTVRLDPHLTALETHRWPRHPACGCTWS